MNDGRNYLEAVNQEYTFDICLTLAKEFGYQLADQRILEFRSEVGYAFQT